MGARACSNNHNHVKQWDSSLSSHSLASDDTTEYASLIWVLMELSAITEYNFSDLWFHIFTPSSLKKRICTYTIKHIKNKITAVSSYIPYTFFQAYPRVKHGPTVSSQWRCRFSEKQKNRRIMTTKSLTTWNRLPIMIIHLCVLFQWYFINRARSFGTSIDKGWSKCIGLPVVVK